MRKYFNKSGVIVMLRRVAPLNTQYFIQNKLIINYFLYIKYR